MTVEELAPEAVSFLGSMVNNPHPIEGKPILQLVLADVVIMGSPAKVHAMRQGLRLLAQYEAQG